MKQEAPFGAAEYRAVFDAAPDAIVIVDGEGRIRDINASAERLFGYPRSELLGTGIEALVPERSRGVHHGEREAYMRDPRARPMGAGLELKGRRKDGSEIPLEISLSPMHSERDPFVIAIVRDVTERMRLRAFGTGALQAAEDERLRISRELHDDTAQRLAALLLKLRLARSAPDEAGRDAALDQLHGEILETADAVRRVARGLRPPSIEDIGLEAAIRLLARNVQEHQGLAVEVEISMTAPSASLAPDAELALYRIVQEALSNAVRHAGASRARLTIEDDGERMTVLVEDDGRGFDPRIEPASGARGLGLIGMRERARLLDGRISIDSAPGAGTRITLEIPR